MKEKQPLSNFTVFLDHIEWCWLRLLIRWVKWRLDDLLCLLLGHTERDDEVSVNLFEEKIDEDKSVVTWYCARCHKSIKQLPWKDAPPYIQVDLFSDK